MYKNQPNTNEYYQSNPNQYYQQPNQSNLGDKIYSGAATFGKIRAWIGVVIAFIIGGFLIYLGVKMVMNVPKRIATVNAKVIDSDKNYTTIKCIPNVVNNKTTYSCNFQLMYNINNIDYILDFASSSNTYNGLSSTTLYYDPNDINNISLISDNEKSTGYLFLGIAAFIIICSLIYLYIIYKVKFFAAATGAVGAVDMFSGHSGFF